jgi:hypothetical protein
MCRFIEDAYPHVSCAIAEGICSACQACPYDGSLERCGCIIRTVLVITGKERKWKCSHGTLRSILHTDRARHAPRIMLPPLAPLSFDHFSGYPEAEVSRNSGQSHPGTRIADHPIEKDSGHPPGLEDHGHRLLFLSSILIGRHRLCPFHPF